MKSRKMVCMLLSAALIAGGVLPIYGTEERIVLEEVAEVPEQEELLPEEEEWTSPEEELTTQEQEEQMLFGSGSMEAEGLQEEFEEQIPENSGETSSSEKMSEQEESPFVEDMGEEELKEAIAEGEVIALAPELLATKELAQASGLENMPAQLAAGDGNYQIIQKGITSVTDVLGSWHWTGMRFLQYTDSTGITRTSPLYCLNASRSSDAVGGMMTEENQYSGNAPIHTVDVLTNMTLQKLLYFGYGGPGDITGKIDPTCQHINWDYMENKYSFTHFALSYIYSGDLGGLPLDRAEEAGLFRFIDLCTSQTLPTFNDLTFYSVNSYTDAQVSTGASGRSISIKMALFPNPDSRISQRTEFKDGFQISNPIAINGCTQNYITVKVPEQANTWRLFYWKNASDHLNLGFEGALVPKPGETVRLYGGYRFLIVAAKNLTSQIKLSAAMGLRPARFILVRGDQNINFPWLHTEPQQDFGAYVYTEAPAVMSLTMTPQPYGRLDLNKKSAYDGKAVSGAQFTMYASEKVYSGYRLLYKKDQKVADIAMSAGQYQFPYLLPGKYYLVEKTPPAGYLPDSGEKYGVTVTAAMCTAPGRNFTPVTLNVTNNPDIQVEVQLQKIDSVTKKELPGAKFVIDEWDGSKYVQNSAYTMAYEEESKRYTSVKKLVWTDRNKGKFRIREVQPPPGYTGEFAKEFVIGDGFPQFEGVLSLGTAENVPSQTRRIKIYKKDSETGGNLSDAEFTLYEWSQSEKGYQEKEILIWNDETQVYESSELEITEENLGRYRLVETKLPAGYSGAYEEDIDISEGEGDIYRTVQNTPPRKLRGTVQIVKRDSETEEPLEGAKFLILEWNEETGAYEDSLRDAGTMSYDGEQKSYQSKELTATDKNLGKFLVREVQNPEGYTGTFEKEFVLQKGEENRFQFVAYNTPPVFMGEITVVKRIREADINWANGFPVFFFVVEGTDKNGISHRYEDYVLFANGEGAYSLDQNRYACLAHTFHNIPEGQYQVYEKPVARYYLTALTAATSNVSVYASGKVGYGTDPKESFVGTVTLNRENPRGELTFTNEKKRWDKFSHNDVVKNVI